LATACEILSLKQCRFRAQTHQNFELLVHTCPQEGKSNENFSKFDIGSKPKVSYRLPNITVIDIEMWDYSSGRTNTTELR